MDIDTLRRDAEEPMIARPEDLPGVAADLADAFTDDVMLNWFFRTDAKKAEDLKNDEGVVMVQSRAAISAERRSRSRHAFWRLVPHSSMNGVRSLWRRVEGCIFDNIPFPGFLR